jgi:hypothetical protein
MKRIFIHLFLFSILICSCVPYRHAVQVEMRYPSKSGLELSGKIMSVVYIDCGDQAADTFSMSLAQGFATELEKDYATGEGSVGVYSLQDKGGKYHQKDTLVNLLMDTGCDVIFLFDKVEMIPLGDKTTKVNIKLYCFDAMNKDEKVFSFVGNKVVNLSTDDLSGEALKTGAIVSDSFKSQWKHEQYSIIYYENEQWFKALTCAQAYDWKGAMDVWFTFLSSNDALKRSCACFNIATACYMSGDYNLASEWLDKSDKDNVLPLSSVLRKRINARK